MAIIDVTSPPISETRTYPDDDWYLHEPLLTFGQLARQVGVNPSTIWRWYDKGCNSRSGIRVMLQGCRRGGRNVTSLERYHRFVRRLNDVDHGSYLNNHGENASLSSRSAHSNGEKQAREAMQLLKARGLLD